MTSQFDFHLFNPTIQFQNFSQPQQQQQQEQQQDQQQQKSQQGQPVKRFQVKRACIHCKKNHAACNNERPCARCIKHGLQDQCIDIERKKRVTKPKLQSEIEKTQIPQVKRRGRPKKSEQQQVQQGLIKTEIEEFNSVSQDRSNFPFQIAQIPTKAQFPMNISYPQIFDQNTFFNHFQEQSQQQFQLIQPDISQFDFLSDNFESNPVEGTNSPFSFIPNMDTSFETISTTSPLLSNESYNGSNESSLSPLPFDQVLISPYQSWTEDANTQMKDLTSAWGQHTWTFPTQERSTSSANSLDGMFDILQSLQSKNDNLQNKLTIVRQQLTDFAARERNSAPSTGDNCFNESANEEICISVWKTTNVGNGILVQCNQKFIDILGFSIEVLKNNFTCNLIIPEGYPGPCSGGTHDIDKEIWPKKSHIQTNFGVKEVCLTLSSLRDSTGKITHLVSHILPKESCARKNCGQQTDCCSESHVNMNDNLQNSNLLPEYTF